jgi:hypothetical protein
MLRTIARIWAKLKYQFDLLHEAARTEINASLAENLAKERRTTVTALRKEADTIDARIKEYTAKEEVGFWLCENGHEFDPLCNCVGNNKEPVVVHASGCRLENFNGKSCIECNAPAKLVKRSEMSGQEKYESDKERKDAEVVAESKRAAAKEEEDKAEGGEQTAKVFRQNAENARAVAEKIRALKWPRNRSMFLRATTRPPI